MTLDETADPAQSDPAFLEQTFVSCRLTVHAKRDRGRGTAAPEIQIPARALDAAFERGRRKFGVETHGQLVLVSLRRDVRRVCRAKRGWLRLQGAWVPFRPGSMVEIRLLEDDAGKKFLSIASFLAPPA